MSVGISASSSASAVAVLLSKSSVMANEHSQEIPPAGILDMERVRAVAEHLAPNKVRRVIPCQGGGNNRVYLLEAGAERFALKFYPAGAERLLREADALRFMQAVQIDHVPRLVAHDVQASAALLTWIDGCVPGPTRDGDIADMAALIAELKQSAAAPASAALSLETEACLSGQEIAGQIERRIHKLATISNEPELARFINDDLKPTFAKAHAHAEAAAGPAWTQELPQRHRAPSPSDFGVHNALRVPTGSLRFLDFEYFGWDDPVKLVADCWWHPGMALSEQHGNIWLDLCRPIFEDDPGFTGRLHAFLPLYGLRWTCIVLNEFLPDRWEHRRAAGRHHDWSKAKVQQLAKANALLHWPHTRVQP